MHTDDRTVEISVVIPVQPRDSYRCASLLRDLASQRDPGAEVIVVNDGGDPRLERICRRYGARHIPITQPKTVYHARNLGIRAARGRKLVFTDADCRLSQGWLLRGRRLLDQFDYVAGPTLIPPLRPGRLWYTFAGAREFTTAYWLEVAGFAPTCNLFVRRELFEELGLFDARLSSSGDVEFGRRVMSAGKYRHHFDEGLVVYHRERTPVEAVRKLRRVNRGYVLFAAFHPHRADPSPAARRAVDRRTLIEKLQRRLAQFDREHPSRLLLLTLDLLWAFLGRYYRFQAELLFRLSGRLTLLPWNHGRDWR